MDGRKPGPPCPYCGVLLATDRAKQCIACGYDWHDPENVVCRRDPNWNRLGLNREATYVLELCQEPTGRRYTKFRNIENGEHDPHCVLETEPASGSQFVEWGWHSDWAKHVRLSNGSGFGFDAHAIWMTEAEVRYLFHDARDTGVKVEEPPWVNGIPPLLPPK